MKRYFISLILFFLCACQNTSAIVPIVVTPSKTLSPNEFIIPASTVEQVSTPVLDDSTEQAVSAIQDIWVRSPHANLMQGGFRANTATLKAVGCNNCHESISGTIIGSKIAWLDTVSQRYQSVADINNLCQKCHDGLKVANHQVVTQSSIHNGFECTDCHDPHSTVPTCSNSSCHQGIIQINDMPPSTPTGGHPQIGNPFCGGPSCHPAATAVALLPQSVHGAAHINVSCEACHDAGNPELGPQENGGIWVTWQTIVQSGNSIKVHYFSHTVQLEVDCKRCHFSNNPWKLPLVTGNEFEK
jgi:hypothetical protein